MDFRGLLDRLLRGGRNRAQGRGRRVGRAPARDARQQTELVRTPTAAPVEPAYAPPPTPAQPPQPAYTPPPQTHPTGPMAPVAAPPPPAAPLPPAPSAEPASAEATRYNAIPGGASGDFVGVLVAIDGDLKGEIFKVFDGENLVGRSDVARIRVASEWVSREHAMIIHQEGAFGIKSVNDKNPTSVNGDGVDACVLSDGDTVEVGRTTLRFRTL